MRRMSSRAVSVVGTATLALALTGLACADSGDEAHEVQTEYGQICVRHNGATGEDERVPDDQCPDDNGNGGRGGHFIWINQTGGHRAPAVGQPVRGLPYLTHPPAGGTFAKVPASGGFGTRIATIGG